MLGFLSHPAGAVWLQRLPAIPQRPLGRDIWAWATALRLDKVTAGSRLGQCTAA